MTITHCGFVSSEGNSFSQHAAFWSSSFFVKPVDGECCGPSVGNGAQRPRLRTSSACRSCMRGRAYRCSPEASINRSACIAAAATAHRSDNPYPTARNFTVVGQTGLRLSTDDAQDCCDPPAASAPPLRLDPSVDCRPAEGAVGNTSSSGASAFHMRDGCFSSANACWSNKESEEHEEASLVEGAFAVFVRASS